jgi:hypothetical protein
MNHLYILNSEIIFCSVSNTNFCTYCVLNKQYFSYRSEEEGEDEVDSDFSIEENDEPISDQDDDEPKKKRRLLTKAYKVW